MFASASPAAKSLYCCWQSQNGRVTSGSQFGIEVQSRAFKPLAQHAAETTSGSRTAIQRTRSPSVIDDSCA